MERKFFSRLFGGIIAIMVAFGSASPASASGIRVDTAACVSCHESSASRASDGYALRVAEWIAALIAYDCPVAVLQPLQLMPLNGQRASTDAIDKSLDGGGTTVLQTASNMQRLPDDVDFT